ncbi:MAG: PDZ domain-containing protein [Burkholderiaceae bacterium]|nr:PDZ domain-containing protein [Burkholderiaceae bacterium]
MTIQYAIRPADLAGHLFHVTITVREPHAQGQCFRLPAWLPGSYMIREFARHVGRVTALAGSRRVRVEKLDKHTWRAAPVRGSLTLAYEVYAWDHSVRAAHLDARFGFFNGACVFMAVCGREAEPCQVKILPPDGDGRARWRVATGLAPAPGTRYGRFGTYAAADYDELIDCPVLLGDFAGAHFEAAGAAHEIALAGSVPKLDTARLAADLARLCATQARLFEPRSRQAPFSRFVFLVHAADDGYGGLEHRNSTALLCRRDSLPYPGMREAGEKYREFLGLASHEYFHSWWVKRVRPAAFIPYDLTRENYTRLLWVFEGFTSYYDDLLLARARLLTEDQYLQALSRTITRVLHSPGRLKQSVADSSFDAWIKYYRPDENTPNAVVSYYQKGALVALALDLTIRAATAGRRSLDDVLRHLWREYQLAGAAYQGVAEQALPEAIAQATGLDLTRHIRAWAEGTEDPDFARLFAPFGIALQRSPVLETPARAMLGVQVRSHEGACQLAHVFDGSPARQAGLSAGDQLVALDGLRVTPATLDTLLARYAPGDQVEVAAFRRDDLLRFTVTLARQAPLRYELKPAARASRAALRLRAGWLGTR